MEVSNEPWELVHKQKWGSKSHIKPEPISPRSLYHKKGRELLKEGAEFLMYDHDNTKEVEELPPALNHNTRLPEIVKQQKVLQLVSDAGKVGLTKMEPPKNFGGFPATSRAQLQSPDRRSTLAGAPTKYSF